MKKWAKCLFSILLIVPIIVGMLFVVSNNASVTLNGGGGGNSLNSPNSEANNDFDNKKEGEEKQTWTTPTFLPFERYVEDFDINADTITTDDLSGKGSQTDPFVIHTTKGFLWVMSGGVVLNSKYLELDCDVVLNDETFDKDGNPSGGDGVVYSWKKKMSPSNGFNGNNHTISGLYFNDPTAVGVYMFDNVTTIENLTMENTFLRGEGSVFGLARACTNINNVHTKNGNIVGQYSLSGIIGAAPNVCTNVTNGNNITQLETPTKSALYGVCQAVNKVFENCANYGDITIENVTYAGGLVSRGGGKNLKNFGTIAWNVSATGVGGISGMSNSTFTNCENYGKLINNTTYRYMGGIVGYNYSTSIYKNCTNYADLVGVSGIAGWGHSAQFYNCENYGNIENPKYLKVGGILGSADQSSSGTVIFKNCKNYGNVVGSAFARHISYYSVEILDCENFGTITFNDYTADFFGVINYINHQNKTIIIKDCYNAGGRPLVGRFYTLNKDNKNLKVIIDNVRSDVNVNRDNHYLILEISGMFSVDIGNVFINCTKQVKNLRLVGTMNYEVESLKIKNVLFYANGSTNTDFLINLRLSGFDKSVIDLSSLVVQNNNGNSAFYGDDFDDYAVDFKTGKVVLKSMEGKGFYQGKVTEEILINKNFTKKAI